MQAADDKTRDVCRKIGIVEGSPAYVAIKLAIKEQDRDTRHACFDAIGALERTVSQCPTVAFCEGFNMACANAAAACINVKAV